MDEDWSKIVGVGLAIVVRICVCFGFDLVPSGVASVVIVYSTVDLSTWVVCYECGIQLRFWWDRLREWAKLRSKQHRSATSKVNAETSTTFSLKVIAFEIRKGRKVFVQPVSQLA